jgi:hypothetical protein
MTKIPAKTPRPIGSTDNVFPGSVKAAGSDVEGCSAAAVAPTSVAVVDDAPLPLAMLLLVDGDIVWDAWSEPDAVVAAAVVMPESVAVPELVAAVESVTVAELVAAAESVTLAELVAVAELVVVAESVTGAAGSTEVVSD